MQYLQFALSPLIALLELALAFFAALTGSAGAAIILLSLFVALVTWPLGNYARRIERKDSALQLEMQPRLAAVRKQFKGEAQFNEIEKIYKEYGYHPIHALKSAAGFIFQLPFLLSSLFLLMESPLLVGHTFLALDDLSKADRLFFGFNALPVFMTAITLVEATIRDGMTLSSRVRFAFVALVILFLVYPLPAGVVLYWTTSNLLSLLRTCGQQRKTSGPSPTPDDPRQETAKS